MSARHSLSVDCAACGEKRCREGADCFGVADAQRELYRDERVARLHRAAAAIEARHYGAATRLEEIILFAREMGFRRLGLAFCVGLEEEAGQIAALLGASFEVVSVCCKVGGIAKAEVGCEQMDAGKDVEVMCNPAGQAALLNEAGTELNILCGLCVGHDALLSMHAAAPVTTLIAKDRVLGHNPAAAVYCRYVRRRIGADRGG
jgi:uncharacterized metal-binding protein